MLLFFYVLKMYKNVKKVHYIDVTYHIYKLKGECNMSSLGKISESNYLTTYYLQPLDPGSITMESASDFLGLREYKPTNVPLASQPTIYRVLGTNKDKLNCNSTILISTSAKTENAKIQCNGEDVFFLKIPLEDDVPYMDLTYGNKLVSDQEFFYGERRNLTIANISGRDLWFEWFRDVHEDYALDFIQNNKHQTRKSRKVSTSAYYPIKVFRNDAGVKGEYLGEFTREVYIHDRIECIVVNISGEDYLQAISIVETPGKILLSVLLG